MSLHEIEDIQQEMQPQEENNEEYANDFHEEPADEEHHVNENQPTGEEQPFADDQPAGEEQPFAEDQPTGEEQPLADDHIADQEQPTGEEQIADQEQDLDPTAEDQDVQDISAEEQQELLEPSSEAAPEQEFEPQSVEQDVEHSVEEEQLPVEQEPAEHLSEQQVVDDQPEQEEVVEPEQQGEQEGHLSGEEEQAEEIAQPNEETVEPETQPEEDVSEPFEEIERGEDAVEPEQVQDEVVELTGQDHDQEEVVEMEQQPTEVVEMEPEQDEVVELADQDQVEQSEQDLAESAKDEDEAPPAPEEQSEADQEENPEEDEDDGAAGAAGETESATQQKSEEDPRSSADLQELMKEFAHTAQQDMHQPILTSMNRPSTDVKYEFNTVEKEQTKTSFEKLESERFNALVEEHNIVSHTTQQIEPDDKSIETAQSYDDTLGHTDSLIELMNKTNGMARDLSNETCCFSMRQSAEYLENDCSIGYNIKSMDRVFSEDIDYNNMHNNVPVVSMKQNARRHFSVGQNSPAISITSSVTDYAELFPDKTNMARMPECNSCEHNFTDDEMAAGWHMWSLDKEAEYSKEHARTSQDPIPPSASAVHDAATTSRNITVEKPQGGAYTETDNETNYEPARKPSRRSTTRQSASRKSHTQELAPNKSTVSRRSITRDSASRKSNHNNLTAERSAARESGTRRSVTKDSRISATKEQDPKDSHRSTARDSLSRKISRRSTNKESVDNKTMPKESMKTIDGTTIHTTEEGKVYAVVDGEKKFSTEEGKYATVNDRRLSIPEGTKIYRTKSGAEYSVVDGVKVVTHTENDKESYAVVKGSKVPTTEEGTYQVVNNQKIYTSNAGATYTVNKDGKKVFAQDAASIEKKHSVGDNAEVRRSCKDKKEKKKGNCFFKNMQQQPCFNNPFFNPYMQFGMCNPWMNGEFVLEKCDDGQMVWLMKPNQEKKRMVYYYDTSCDEGKKEKKEKLPDISQGQNVIRKKRSSKKKMAGLPQMNPYMAAQMGQFMNPYQNQMNPYMQYQQMMAQNNMLKAMKKQRSSSKQ